LLKNRPFVGANETTALMALLRFLALNQAALKDDVSATELIWLAQSVNRSDLDREGMEQWLRENLTVERQ
jgi:prophage maintenance system killer protein